jgi:hypothetical protein
MSIEPKIAATDIESLDPNINDCRVVGGWVSPEGKYFKVPGIWAHELLAQQISGSAEVGGRALELAGWVHITGKGSPGILRGLAYTKAQFETLFDLGVKFEHCEFGKTILAGIGPAQEQ